MAGLVLAHLRAPVQSRVFAAGAVLGAAVALVRPGLKAWRHGVAAALAAAAGGLTALVPEPAFFLLAPLLAAGIAWPLRSAEDEPEGIPRALPRWAVPTLFALAAAVLFAQSADRYWGFGAGSKDLGLFYQTHWLIAHGHAPLNTVMGMHALADHMELVDYAVAPLLWVHDGPETLLAAQSLAIASAVFPLFWLGRQVLESSRAGLTLAGAWLLAPDMHMGVMFDYNPTLLGASGLLWTAWALMCRGLPASMVAGAITCLTKENLCLYVAVLAGVLALRGPTRRSLVVLAMALAVFTVEMTLVFPRFRPGGFRHWEFEELGDTPGETAAAAVTRPHAAADLLLNHPQKRRALLQPLAVTGFAGLADPLSIVLQLPNWGERLLSSHGTRWWGYHYGVPAAATAVVGLLLGWRRLRQARRDGPALPRYVLACALVVGVLPPYRTPAGNRRSDLYHLRQSYVVAAEDAATMRAAIAFVGHDPRIKVAAQDRLLPALAGRLEIYMLDRAMDADVVVLQMNGATWPDGRPSWRRRLREIWGSGAFAVAFCQGQTVVLRRGAPPGLDCPPFQAQLISGAVPP
ncbi:MAG TPA: DUF2079 domain-containing protein [Vicinamibacteria bacterium]|nr:DUF2079 domain-containing protein [Vicinamibacteria bacterium]